MLQTKKILLSIILLNLSFIFNAVLFGQVDKNKKEKTIAKHIFTSSYNVAIFPDSHPFPVQGERFTPSENDVFFAERALSRDMRFLNKERLHQTDDFLIHARLRVFNRQYFGYINEDGEKVLIINAFWNKIEQESENAWLNKTIKGSQAPYFWKVKYNIDLNELYDLKIASPASDSSLPSDADHKADETEIEGGGE